VKEQEKSTESLQMQPLEEIQAKSSSGEPQEKEEQNQESVQTKLTVGAPGDKYEQEADSMAGKVMAMPDEAVEQPVQRQTGEDTEAVQMQPEEEIQAKSSSSEPQEKEEQNQESVQTKLTVGAPGDKHEQEADSMAGKVMTMPDEAIQQPIQRQTGEDTEAVQMQPLVNSITPLVQRSSGEEEEVQMKSGAQRVSDGSSQASGSVENRLAGSKGGGSALPDDVRSFMEPRFGAEFSGVRVHTDSNAVQMNKELGAQAFAHGSDIYYGAGKSPGKDELTAHELTHVVQQTGSTQTKNTNQATTSVVHHSQPAQQKVLSSKPAISSVDSAGTIQLRRATWLERRAWLSFFNHYLPRKFLNHYMDDTGTALNLTQQEMIDCNPIVNLRRSPDFLKELAALQEARGGSKWISISGWGGALTNGTLGNFTIYYDGQLTVYAKGNWKFRGEMHFYDYWNFDPKSSGSGRPLPAELKVRIASIALPGQPFAINSVKVRVGQTDKDERATWAGGTPSPVGDNAVRTGADMAAGFDAGVGGGPTGAAAGVEVGAQSSEDLN
jgi:hypothetical protein